ncbi:peptidyl-prolyl cis-trans isomerase [Xylona heveae TC161]|uniref:peptidylprolyl isomerase n=1 Tax=Xylona heveae (strain CBS 132557 / TC161) TaxID=1328760 RepID=A0A165IWX1_XYLHT|nr:peptidyl-prolyl cis-trans isomerase [Xylona heveae TC161]KZF25489.1 peptidyl-prolyl cis-trans isomerase [Xylona heveae TC161]
MAGKPVDIKVLKQGNGQDRPQAGDTVTIEYTGWLHDASAGAGNDFKGKQFDSSRGRGDFVTQIGVGKVIKGWDEGVQRMTLGEKSTLTIDSSKAYGESGFPGHIPPNAQLIFDVELKGINNKRA